ncbi:MAG: WD40 repeat domain-containing protein, partial [Anaerolineae bacterium]|nr:WD40 repeat domain-containing protein [Anaerolineae bacterium]
MKIRIVIPLLFLFTLLTLSAPVTAQSNRIIRADNAASIQPLATLPIHSASLIGFSADSQTLLADNVLSNLHTLEQLSFGYYVYPLAMSSSGRYIILVSQTADDTQLLDLVTSDRYVILPMPANRAVFSPDESVFITYSDDENLYQVWDTATRGEIGAVVAQPASNYFSPYHTAPSFTPDGQNIVLSSDHGFTVWNIAERKERLSLPTASTESILSDDGSILITFGHQSFEIWDIASGRQLAGVDYESIDASEPRALISPDNHACIIWDGRWNTRLERGNPRLWDIHDPAHVRLIAEIPDAKTDTRFQFSPDSRWLSAYGRADNGSIRLFDTESGELHTTIAAHPPVVGYFAFSADGSLLFSSGLDNTIKIWRWDGTEATQLASLPGNNFRLSPDETTLVTTIDERIVLVYGIPSPESSPQPLSIPAHVVPSSINVRREPARNSEIIGTISNSVLAAGRQGDFLFVLDRYGWVLGDPAYIQLDDGFPLSFLPEISTDQANAMKPTVYIFPTPDPTAIPLPTAPPGPIPTGNPVDSIPEPPAGLVRMTPANLPQVRLLGVLPGSMSQSFYPRSSGAVSVDGTVVITASSGRLLPRAWNLLNLSDIGMPDLDQRTSNLHSAASPTGDLIAFMGSDPGRAISFWDVASHSIVGVMDAPDSGLIEQFRFSPDGATLVSSGSYASIRVWDTASRTQRFALPSVNLVEFSPDSQVIVIMDRWDGVVRGYDVVTGHKRFQFNPHSLYAEKVFFNPAGTAVAVMGSDALTVWSILPGSIGAMQARLPKRFVGAIFSPDGQFLTTTDSY